MGALLIETPCPACGHQLAFPFYDGGRQPLTTLAWPRSAAEAQSMEALPLDFIRCVSCGHVFNQAFDYAKVPYSDKPNLMFNKGALWREHLEATAGELSRGLPARPTVVEIGCGDGHLLRTLAKANPNGRFVGFDPNGAIETGDGLVEAQYKLFEPAVHLLEYRPDLIMIRHVLEHLTQPLAFLQALSFAAAWHGLKPRLFVEVPCIDRVFATHRTADFFYEHNSHFTRASLATLLSRGGAAVDRIETPYDGEVLTALVQLGREHRDANAPMTASGADSVAIARDSIAFYNHTRHSDAVLRARIDDLAQTGSRVAVWGGTGKAAAFINRYGLDATRFPLVVDSDASKVGTFVPGAGQEILRPDALLRDPVEAILIATQWRARDIAREIEAAGIPYHRLLLEHEGRLIDYHRDAHPYRDDAARAQNADKTVIRLTTRPQA
ncbi:MAG: methyltransferase domain-containing protein [Vampirovibrionales bacterium]|nr:methyltransferase domain-containing protein [Vampirovibrionales bacterium]